MAGSVADIAIKVIANANGVGPGLDKAERELLKFDEAARRIAASPSGGLSILSKSLVGIGAGLSAAAVGNSIVKTIGSLDDLGDLADALGDNVENISRLHFAATQLGSSAEAVDKTMAKMVKAIGEVGIGGDETRKAIEGIGLSTETLKSQSPSKTFTDIVDAIGKLPTVYDRAGVAGKIFGKGAIEILSILKAGSGQIKEMSDRLDELHGTVTTTQAQLGGDLQNTLQETSAAWQGLKNDTVAAFGPAFKVMMKAASAEIEGLWFASKLLQQAFSRKDVFGIYDAANKKPADTSVAEAENAIAKLEEEEKKQQKLQELTARVLNEIKTAEQIFDEKNDAAWELFEAGKISYGQYWTAFQKYLGELDRAVEARNEVLDRIEEVGRLDITMNEKQKDAYNRMTPKGQIEAQNKLNDTKDRAALIETKRYGDAEVAAKRQADRITAENMTPLERYQEQVDVINKSFDEGRISAETFARAMQKAWDELNGPDTPGYSNLSVTGGDMPGMFSPDPAYDRFMQYNTLRGGYVGNLAPNIPSFTPPEWGSRQAGPSAYGDAGYGMDTNNELLNTIARNTRDQGVYA